LFVGDSRPRKNLEGLLRALTILDMKGLDTNLVVVGIDERHGRAYKRILGGNRTSQRVTFIGRVPDADMPAIYAAAEALVFPSFYEGFGFPPLEAFGCGTPVVCANTSSLPEVVSNAALAVDPRDPRKLAEAVGVILTDEKLRTELRERGFERAKVFTWHRSAIQTVRIYNRLAKSE